MFYVALHMMQKTMSNVHVYEVQQVAKQILNYCDGVMNVCILEDENRNVIKIY